MKNGEKNKILKTFMDYYDIMKKHGIFDLQIEDKETSLKIKRFESIKIESVSLKQQVFLSPKQETQETKPSVEKSKNIESITAPLNGVFYRSPSPSAPTYVNEGDIVEVGKVICIIEAMKVMNEIKSPFAGKIIKILVDNGQPVTKGQEIFLIDTSVGG